MAIDYAAYSPQPSKPGVQRTKELLRILALPRRTLDLEGSKIIDLTPLYLKHSGKCSEYPYCPICINGPVKLWPAQSAALFEAQRAWGLFAPLGVGSGKTVLSLLLPDVFNATRTVLLVPAQLKNQLLTRDIPAYARHFRIPDGIRVVSYTQLSIAKSAGILEEIKPDLVIADECHNVSRPSAARTKRFIRFFKQNPDTIFCALSGTITKRSLRDYSHLCEISLHANSPVPNNWSDLQEWAEALDQIPIHKSRPPGALKVFAIGDSRLLEGSENVRIAVREGYRRRLVDTLGVVATSESWQGASLIVSALDMEIPEDVIHMLNILNDTWQIGGEELEDAARFVEAMKQLAIGFYYEWQWPDGIKDYEWLLPRAAWHKQIRQILKLSREGIDSPLLVARAASQNRLAPEAQEAWEAWKLVKDRYNPTPPVKAIWINDFAIRAAVKWAREEQPVILWYSRQAVGQALSEQGLPVYGAGTDAGEADPKIQPVIACSISSQGTGKNLQRYAKALVIEPPGSGAVWEQLLGRLHRPGQQADEVTFDVFAHTRYLKESLYKAVKDAEYVEQTQGQKQKILKVQRIGW